MTSTTSRAHTRRRLDTIEQVFVGHDPDTYFQSWAFGHCTTTSTPISIGAHERCTLSTKKLCLPVRAPQMGLWSAKAHWSSGIWEGFVYCDYRHDGCSVYWVSEGNEGFDSTEGLRAVPEPNPKNQLCATEIM
ncbi:unnamed protein product [Pleuronectes platessa]|uniref:Uncharacterized protein n=1 Tax=Pleuronectes platessa TaxID=8262 RepID=A0A9N7YT05_PLEPL|nr:unnamed protein product [Pleuronectes platessa]